MKTSHTHTLCSSMKAFLISHSSPLPSFLNSSHNPSACWQMQCPIKDTISFALFFPLKASCIETEVKCLWLICEKWYLRQINQWKGWKGETGSREKKETTAHNLPSAISSSGCHYGCFISSTNIVILSVCLSVCYRSPPLLHSLCLSFPFIKPSFFPI